MIRDPWLIYCLGWASACVFIWLGEWLTSPVAPDPFEDAFGDVPPLRDLKLPHRLAGVPECNSAPSQIAGGNDSSGFDTLHHFSSSRLLSGGSDGTL